MPFAQRPFPIVFAVLLALFAFGGSPGLRAQTGNAGVSGEVNDSTGAHIPKAKVVLVNQSNRSSSNSSTTNSKGVFSFSSVPAGVYQLTVTSSGFSTYVETDIALHPGDDAQLPPIKMKVGAEDVTIEVSAHDEITSNGEVSSLITSEDIKHLATEGRDVTELVKILPGFALQPGSSSSYGMSNQAPDTEVVAPGGALGNYAANGSPSNGIGLISDGADVQDPGAGGATTQTINMDMVEEVKISTSNFGADNAKGPVVINAVGKSGGDAYHGNLHIIARTYQLNAQDWLVKNQGQPKPADRYLYPGASIGGPVKIPGTRFNRSNKFIFLVSGEDYVQRNAFVGGNGAAALRLTTVPTDCMRGLAYDSYAKTPCANPGMADFSLTQLANLFNKAPAALQSECNPLNANPITGDLFTFDTWCVPFVGHTPQGLMVSTNATSTSNTFPAADIDPGIQAYLTHIFPHQNRTAQPVAGTAQTSDGYDRTDVYLTNYDLYQIRGRLDYNFSQNNKLYGVYNIEPGHNYMPFTLYYNPSGGNGILKDPSLIKGGINSQTLSANYVHIFGPTLTSETFGSASYYFNNFNAANPAGNTSAALGYPYVGILNNGSNQLPQLGYGGHGVPLFQEPDFSFGQSFSRKIALSAGENVTKVWKQHTIKVGFYFEHVLNNQLTATGATQGAGNEYGTYTQFPYANPAQITGHSADAPNNTLAQFLFGEFNNYSQQTINPIVDMNYNVIDGFVTDSWKATRRLTLTLGVRFDHLGPWTDPHGVGPAFWYPQAYSTPMTAYGTGATAVPLNQLPGLDWHGKDHSVIDAVQPGRWAFVSPRLGIALDAYGDGKTVFNGGIGLFRSHDSWNDYTNSLQTSLGTGVITPTSYANNSGTGMTLACANAIALKTAPTDPICSYYAVGGTSAVYVPAANTFFGSNQTSINVADPNDSEQPLTMTYSFGVNQAFRHAGNLIINYVGNLSSNLLLASSEGANVNAIPQGGLFKPDPNMADAANYGVITSVPDNISLLSDFRPFPFYGNIYEVRHALHSSYNAAQITLSKYSGPFHYNVNYTWSKALGDRGVDGNGSVPDATNFRNDYGIAAFDRTHILNASYTYIEGHPFHADRIVSGFVNGWEISGITNLQSGPNIQASYGNNFQLSSILSSNTASNVDNKTYLGTPDIFLQPVMTCNPAQGLKSGQFINSSCLTLGAQGVNGPFTYPYLRGPAFFNSDLSAQKNFRLADKKSIEVRFAAFNFLNHPLTSLVAATASPLKLVLAGPGAQANSTFGISDYKQGRRVCEVTLRYNF